MTQQIINVGEVANDGTGESLRTAFEAVNNNFSQIWASGPVNTNVVIANNVISTTPVNTPLILAPGGIGNVQSNAHVIPGVSGVYDLGAPNRRWDSTFSDYYYGNGFFLTGIQAANVSSLVNGNSNIVVQGPDGVITVSINGVPNVATFTTTGINVSGAITASGNVAGDYFIGNGSLLTGIVASGGASIDNGNSNVTIGGSASNITVGVSGVGNVAVFTPTGLDVANSITASTLVVSGNITAARFAGNGAALSNITGANVTGNVPRATYAYTAAIAGIAGIANTVSDNAQPNITSVGILNSLQVTGNITGNYIYGNGRYLTGIQGNGGGSGGSVTFANIAPASPNVGDIWIQANTGTQFLYFSDSNSAQWAEMEAYESIGTTVIQDTSNTGNIGFSNVTMYSLDGLTVDNSDLTHGATAGLTIPPNGTGDISLLNYYGNLTITVGTSPSTTKSWRFDPSGDLFGQGNVTADYFIGNGSQLTGLPAGYSNSDVVAYGQAGWAGNIIPSADAVYSLGNSTNQWANLWVAGNTIYLGGVPVGIAAGNILTVNGQAVLSNNSNATVSTTGNISAGNIFGNIAAPDGNTSVVINVEGFLGAAAGFSYDYAGNTLYVETVNVSGKNELGQEAIYAGVSGFTPLGSNVVAQLAGDAHTYTQINFQNISDDPKASGDYIVTANNGTDTENFIDMGIASNNWDGTQLNSLGTAVQANDGYLYVNGANLVVGTYLNAGPVINAWTFGTDGNLTLPSNTSVINYANGQPYVSAQGATGAQGTDGAQGTTGAQGVDGIQGAVGTQGVEGAQGTTGAQGVAGSNGAQGIDGVQGATGAQGTDGAQGIQGTTGVQGTDGVQGADGAQGATGAGTQGATGAQGTDGAQGATGAGTQGTTGAQGATGTQGTTGTGTQGATGAQGNSGSNGTQGATGAQGTTGTQGATGTFSGNLTANIDGQGYSISNVATISTTGNITSGNIALTGNLTVNGSPIYGVAASYGKYTRTTAQTSGGFAANSIVICNVTEAAFGSDISSNSGTGQITLTAGRTYRLRGKVPAFTASSGGGRPTFCWYNETTAAYIGEAAMAYGASDSATFGAFGGTAEVIITPGVTTVVSFRLLGSNGTITGFGQNGDFSATGDYPWVDIQVIGGQAPITAFSTAGNVTGGNILTAGIVSATGNVTGNYFIGDGSQLTGLPATYGNANVVANLAALGSNPVSTTGNISGGNLATAGNVTFTANSSNITFNTGAYISGNANSISRDGSILLSPYTGAGSTFPGVVIGGAGRLLAPNGSVHQIFNTSDVTTQVVSKIIVGTAATSTTSGALQVTGGIGATGNIYSGGTANTGVSALVAGFTNTLLANTVAGFTGNVNSYTQVTFQNKNTGADATSDFILTADNGSDTTNYSDFGIINSGYDNTTPTNSLGNIVFAADTYLYAQGNTGNASQSGGNLAIGTTVPGKNVKIFAGGVTSSNIVANISNTGVAVTGTVSATGNITAQNFIGNISITGNVTGTSPNVSLVAGSYTYTFDNGGIFTLPAPATGNEGGEIDFGKAGNSTLSGSAIVLDQYVDRFRFFESGGNTRGAYIDLSQAAAGVGTLLNNRVSGLVNAGTFVTMDLIKATVTTSGNRGLSLAATTGSFSIYIGGNYSTTGPSASGAAGSGTINTTPSASQFNWNFTGAGDTSTYIITDTTNSRAYRITLQIGGSYLNNLITIERLV